MTDFVTALEAEIAKLENELRTDVRFVRLRELQRIQQLYNNSNIDNNLLIVRNIDSTNKINVHKNITYSEVNRPKDSHVEVTSAQQPGRRTSPEKIKALDAVAMHLNNRSGPVPTRELLEHLLNLNIEIGGSTPLNNLSAMLSNSDLFESHGRAGWTLKRQVDEKDATAKTYFECCADLLERMSDESLSGVLSYIAQYGELPPDVRDGLTNLFYEKTENEHIFDTRDEFSRTFEDLLRNEIKERASSFSHF